MLRYIKDVIGQAAAWAAKKLILRFRDPLIKRATMTPYFHLINDEGDPYMLRYWLVPYTYQGSHSTDGCGPVKFWHRPLAWLLQKLGIAIRIHCIMRSDSDRALHDHPWDFVTVLLDGTYYEHRPVYDDGLYAGDSLTRYEAGSVLFRRASDLHRLEVPEGQMVWTLFITGPRKQAWGFVENLANKVYYRDYLDEQNLTKLKAEEEEDDYNFELGTLLDFIVDGFGATEDHDTIRAAIRKHSPKLSDQEIDAVMSRIVKPREVIQSISITIPVDGKTSEQIKALANTVAGERVSWLMARCKTCNGVTHASKWWLPMETGPMTKERGKLEAEGRYPFTGVYAAGMAWCQCDETKTIAHRVQS